MRHDLCGACAAKLAEDYELREIARQMEELFR